MKFALSLPIAKSGKYLVTWFSGSNDGKIRYVSLEGWGTLKQSYRWLKVAGQLLNLNKLKRSPWSSFLFFYE